MSENLSYFDIEDFYFAESDSDYNQDYENSPVSNVESPSTEQNRSISPETNVGNPLQNSGSISSEINTNNPLHNDDSTFNNIDIELQNMFNDSTLNATDTEVNNILNAIDFVNRGDQFQRFAIDNDQQDLSNRRRRASKRKIPLSDNARELKYRYYSIFTDSKKFPKEFVLQIHKDYLVEKLKYPNLTRDQMRQIDLYFAAYEEKKDEILKFLEKNKEELLQGPLKDIKKKKSF